MADINRIGIALVAAMLACVSQASWYWPFGGSDEEKEPPRLSELMEPASLLIDQAADLASEGKVQDAVEKYREALSRLDRIEAENADRAKRPEFATLRNKRAYVCAAIDSLLLEQVKSNAKAVAVSDTTELEKKLAAEQAKPVTQAKPVKQAISEESAPRPRNRRERAMACIVRGDFDAAKAVIDEMLAEKPNSPAALNLKAVMEIRKGSFEDAEQTLNHCIAVNPESYYAYFNMAELKIQAGDRIKAKRYYDTGRAYGGSRNLKLEAKLK